MFPAGILHNTKLERWHPIIFRPGPAPSSDPYDDVQRFKSHGHHTDGYPSIEEARAYFEIPSVKEQGVRDTGTVWSWGGEEIPALVCWFSISALAKGELSTTVKQDGNEKPELQVTE